MQKYDLFIFIANLSKGTREVGASEEVPVIFYIFCQNFHSCWKIKNPQHLKRNPQIQFNF